MKYLLVTFFCFFGESGDGKLVYPFQNLVEKTKNSNPESIPPSPKKKLSEVVEPIRQVLIEKSLNKVEAKSTSEDSLVETKQGYEESQESSEVTQEIAPVFILT